ncbi:MAG: GNAT family N-acetyltransferase [Actinomycetota bacterium]|nr:GNAT family N-acetyltransferase [Actinomycetota bacterium]
MSFRRCGAAEARQLSDTVEALYVSSYVDAIASGDSFNSVEAFMSRFRAYSSQPAFDLVIAYHDGQPIGQAWGWPLSAETGWWTGLRTEPEPGFVHEDGRRTFALSEIMVVREWAGKGIAHALHDTLLSARSEQRATLLVLPENAAAYRAYQRWGWRTVAQLRPGWDDAPLLDVLIRST